MRTPTGRSLTTEADVAVHEHKCPAALAGRVTEHVYYLYRKDHPPHFHYLPAVAQATLTSFTSSDCVLSGISNLRRDFCLSYIFI